MNGEGIAGRESRQAAMRPKPRVALIAPGPAVPGGQGHQARILRFRGRNLAFHLSHLLDSLDQFGLEKIDPVFEGSRVNLKQEVALLDGLVFQDIDLNHLAFHPSGHLNDEGLNVCVCGERRVAVRQHIVGYQDCDQQEDENDESLAHVVAPQSLSAP